MVSLVRWISALFGLSLQTNFVYVTSFQRSFGTAWWGMNMIVSVPLTRPPTPCASQPNSFADDILHSFLYCGWVINCRYRSVFPCSSMVVRACCRLRMVERVFDAGPVLWCVTCFDYNATPSDPLGCAVQIHNAVEQRATWGKHSLDGWYLGTSPEHYQCYSIHVNQSIVLT